MKKKAIALSLALMLSAPAVLQAAVSYNTEVIQGVNLRSQPDTDSRVYRTLPDGEDIHVISQVNSYWLKVQTKDGTIGYISAQPKYTNYSGSTPAAPAAPVVTTTADRMIADAKQLMSKVTYDWGTRNPQRYIFDCSSFVEYVFEKNGVELPWGTSKLQYEGKYVHQTKLQKGDLVFFWTKQAGTVNHVGIYLGDGMFIHNAPSYDGVGIDSLMEGYWSNHYMKARRVL